MHDPASKSCSSYRFFDILEIRCNKVIDQIVSEILSRNITFLKWSRTFWLFPFTSQEHWGAEPQSCLRSVWNALFGEPSQHFMYASQNKQSIRKKKICKFRLLVKKKFSDMCRYMRWSLDSPSEKGFDSFLELNCMMMMGNGVYLDSSGMNQSVNTAVGVEPNHCRILPDGKRRCEGATYSPSHAITWWSLVKCRQRISILPLM